MKKYLAKLCFTAMVMLSVFTTEVSSSPPEAYSSMPFLLISPSARVNGMGQAGVALTDEPGGYYNPASPAFVTQHHYFSIKSYITEMKWFIDDVTYRYSSFQAGYDLKIYDFGSIPFSISGALSYYYTKLNLGKWYIKLPSSGIEGYITSYNKAHNYVLSAAAHSLIDVGFGLTIKKYYDKQFGPDPILKKLNGNANGTAYDYGIMARVPLFDIIELYNRNKRDRIHPFLDISTGITWNNRGDKVKYSNVSHTDLLPSNRKAGIAISGGVKYEKRLKLDIFKVTTTYERYTPQIEGIETKSKYSDNKFGLELSFLETFELRYGKYDDDDGEVHLNSFGCTIKSDGIFKVMANEGINNQGILYYLVTHSPFSVTYFIYKKSKGSNPLIDLYHWQFSINLLKF